MPIFRGRARLAAASSIPRTGYVSNQAALPRGARPVSLLQRPLFCKAGLSGAAPLDDRVLQRAYAVDRDPDQVARLEAEIIRRHDAGAGQKDQAAWEVIVPSQPFD